jgi:hypothetical protein
MKRFILVALTITLLSIVAPKLQADTIISQTYSGLFPANITGALPNQDTVLLETFTLSMSSDLTITTSSYASGGFEPNLLLFGATGDFITAGTPFGVPDPSTGFVGDSRLFASNLVAGKYTVAVTDFLVSQSPTATNLSDGFTVNLGSGTTFVDAHGNVRTGKYAFSIAPTPIPEPTTMWLSAAFLSMLAMKAWKRPLKRNDRIGGNHDTEEHS